MAKNLLTERGILSSLKEARATDGPIIISDGAGLTLICRPDGAAWWRLRYWMDKRDHRLSLGTYPKVSLKDARERCEQAQRLVAAGVNPGKQRKSEKIQRELEREARALADAGLPGPGTYGTGSRQCTNPR